MSRGLDRSVFTVPPTRPLHYRYPAARIHKLFGFRTTVLRITTLCDGRLPSSQYDSN